MAVVVHDSERSQDSEECPSGSAIQLFPFFKGMKLIAAASLSGADSQERILLGPFSLCLYQLVNNSEHEISFPKQIYSIIYKQNAIDRMVSDRHLFWGHVWLGS